MMKPKYFALIMLLLMLITLATEKQVRDESNSLELNVTSLRYFLESQYVPEAGLLRAAVKSYPDNETIYIANDNLLASRALVALNSPLGERILRNLEANYSGGWNGKVDVLFGRRITGVYCSKILFINRTYSRKFGAEFEIKYELTDTSCPMDDWREYADLSVYMALNKILSGKRREAVEVYEGLLSLWDGKGFRDKAFDGTYQTYKCALFAYLHRALDRPEQGKAVYTSCQRIVSQLQMENGGISTGYKFEGEKIVPVGDTNTETTSFVVLAFLSELPEKYHT